MTGNQKKPTLNEEDLKLWRQVTDNLNPLQKKFRDLESTVPAKSRDTLSSGDTNITSEKKTKPQASPASRTTRPVSPKPTAMETRRVRRLARGSLSFDARIDLHGMTQNEAHSRLLLFLGEARRRGYRNVLVITGKGRAGDRSPETGREPPGVIRRNFHHWLGEPAFAELVAALSPARQHHGGDGAFYLQIRRARD